MPDLGQISRVQASTLAGLAPTATDGGQIRGKRMVDMLAGRRTRKVW